MKNTEQIINEIDKKISNYTEKLQAELQTGNKHDKDLCQIWTGLIEELKELKKWINKD